MEINEKYRGGIKKLHYLMAMTSKTVLLEINK